MIILTELFKDVTDEALRKEIVEFYKEIKQSGVMSYFTNADILEVINDAHDINILENMYGG